jgi:hypothetical protein
MRSLCRIVHAAYRHAARCARVRRKMPRGALVCAGTAARPVRTRRNFRAECSARRGCRAEHARWDCRAYSAASAGA